jgi:hypothetical protein
MSSCDVGDSVVALSAIKSSESVESLGSVVVTPGGTASLLFAEKKAPSSSPSSSLSSPNKNQAPPAERPATSIIAMTIARQITFLLYRDDDLAGAGDDDDDDLATSFSEDMGSAICMTVALVDDDRLVWAWRVVTATFGTSGGLSSTRVATNTGPCVVKSGPSLACMEEEEKDSTDRVSKSSW